VIDYSNGVNVPFGIPGFNATGFEGDVQRIEYYPDGRVKTVERVVRGFGGGLMKFIDNYPPK